jgi:hypothetical protein
VNKRKFYLRLTYSVTLFLKKYPKTGGFKIEKAWLEDFLKSNHMKNHYKKVNYITENIQKIINLLTPLFCSWNRT